MKETVARLKKQLIMLSKKDSKSQKYCLLVVLSVLYKIRLRFNPPDCITKLKYYFNIALLQNIQLIIIVFFFLFFFHQYKNELEEHKF